VAVVTPSPEPNDVDEHDDYEACECCGGSWPMDELDIDGRCPDCYDEEADAA